MLRYKKVTVDFGWHTEFIILLNYSVDCHQWQGCNDVQLKDVATLYRSVVPYILGTWISVVSTWTSRKTVFIKKITYQLLLNKNIVNAHWNGSQWEKGWSDIKTPKCTVTLSVLSTVCVSAVFVRLNLFEGMVWFNVTPLALWTSSSTRQNKKSTAIIIFSSEAYDNNLYQPALVRFCVRKLQVRKSALAWLNVSENNWLLSIIFLMLHLFSQTFFLGSIKRPCIKPFVHQPDDCPSGLTGRWMFASYISTWVCTLLENTN